MKLRRTTGLAVGAAVLAGAAWLGVGAADACACNPMPAAAKPYLKAVTGPAQHDRFRDWGVGWMKPEGPFRDEAWLKKLANSMRFDINLRGGGKAPFSFTCVLDTAPNRVATPYPEAPVVRSNVWCYALRPAYDYRPSYVVHVRRDGMYEKRQWD